MAKLSVKDLNLKGKRVFVRVDFNVPLKDGKIQDDARITAALPTVNYILNNGGRVILASHLGRPKGNGFEQEFSLKPVFDRLRQEFQDKVFYSKDVVGEQVVEKSKSLKDGEILLIENLRFYKGEKKGDLDFAKQLSKLGELYVNDAFGTCHRKDTSVYTLAKLFETPVAGFLLDKEIHYFDGVLKTPEKPYVAILGGAKVSDKIPVINNLIGKVDTIVIGGAMAYTFLKAKGVAVGKSLVEEEKLEMAKEFIKRADNGEFKLLLPADHIASTRLDENGDIIITESESIEDNYMGLDIGPETIVTYKETIENAKTVVWNGPMGVFEIDKFAVGTVSIAESLAESSCISVVGGGDSASAVKKAKVSDKISHVSTGGGASLEYLSGNVLPGIEVLADK
jgi:phosphoglycerate kinase